MDARPSGGYADAIAALGRALTFGVHPSLDTIRALTHVLGEPQGGYRCVQVTGTNGKTSVTRMTAALLTAHGVRTGSYTSPHLVSYTERMELDGIPVSEPRFAEAITAALDAAERVGATATEFELLTAAALLLFADVGVEAAVLEVGMGGRWDATSVVSPAVAVVTGVALDHTERLGSTREQIAADKAHVIRPGSVAVLGAGCAGVEHILMDRALLVGSPTIRVGQAEDDVTWRVTATPGRPGGELRLDVDGSLDRYPGLALRTPSYQAPNVACAIAAAEGFLGTPLVLSAVRTALARVTFPGRFELLRDDPPLVIDGAHNPEAAGALATAIAEAFADTPPVIVLGVLADKDAEGIIAALAPVSAHFVSVANSSPRSLDAETLAGLVERVSGRPCEVALDVADALARADELSGSAGVVVTGSLYTVGEARSLLATT